MYVMGLCEIDNDLIDIHIIPPSLHDLRHYPSLIYGDDKYFRFAYYRKTTYLCPLLSLFELFSIDQAKNQT